MATVRQLLDEKGHNVITVGTLHVWQDVNRACRYAQAALICEGVCLGQASFRRSVTQR
jgi:hypothetical protein